MNEVKLVEFTEEYVEMVREWRNSPEVSSYMYNDQTISPEQHRNWFLNISKDITSKYWIIKYQGQALGLVSLTGIDKKLNSCYWAFYLGNTSIRGAGIGGKVEYMVLEYVFEVLNLNKLRCEVFIFNEKVIIMHEKFGFRREAYYREHCPKNGKYHDVVGLAILKSEWISLKPQLKIKVYGN